MQNSDNSMIQINNLSSKIISHYPELHAVIDKVIKSGWVILGAEVKQFEQKFAKYLGAEHCITVANGTDAIELALRALGINKGDSVATVANAGMYTTIAILAIGANPFYLDVDILTHNTTTQEVERAINYGIKAVVITHLYGLATPGIQKIAKMCQDKGVLLLEDCAQAHGAQIEGKYVGTFGDASSFSFYPTKNLGALGDGGAIVTNNFSIAQKVSRLRQYGWSTKYRVEIGGARNSRLDELQAAILSVFLPHLNNSNLRRRDIASRYSKHIKHSQIHLPKTGGTEYIAHLYVVRSSKRDALCKYLADLGIGSEVHYPVPDYRQEIFGDLFNAIRLENTETLAREILTLPCYPEMVESEIERVIKAVNSWPA